MYKTEQRRTVQSRQLKKKKKNEIKVQETV